MSNESLKKSVEDAILTLAKCLVDIEKQDEKMMADQEAAKNLARSANEAAKIAAERMQRELSEKQIVQNPSLLEGLRDYVNPYANPYTQAVIDSTKSQVNPQNPYQQNPGQFGGSRYGLGPYGGKA